MRNQLVITSFLLCFIVSLAIIFYGHSTFCADLPPKERMAKADVVFLATVARTGGQLKRYVKFDIEERFKGDLDDELIIESRMFMPSQRYLVYGTWWEERLIVNRCGGWKPAEEAGEDSRALRLQVDHSR